MLSRGKLLLKLAKAKTKDENKTAPKPGTFLVPADDESISKFKFKFIFQCMHDKVVVVATIMQLGR